MPNDDGSVVSALERASAAARSLRGLDMAAGGGREGLLRGELEMGLGREVADAARAISGVEDPEGRTALYAHYIEGRTWREVAGIIGRSERYVYKLRARCVSGLCGLGAS